MLSFDPGLGLLYVSAESGTISVFRVRGKELVSQGQMTMPHAHSVCVDPGTHLVYLPLENGSIAALSLATGQPIWRQRLAGRPGALTPLDDRVFVAADDKFFYCLAAKTGRPKWRWRTGGTEVGVPVVDEDNVYFLAMDNARQKRFPAGKAGSATITIPIN